MSENTLKKRCLVKKLDFDNCVVGSFRTGGKKRKKYLQAKLTKDEDPLDKTPDKPSKGIVESIKESESPVFILKRLSKPRAETLTVASRNKKETSTSPVFRVRRNVSSVPCPEKFFHSKRKIDFGQEIIPSSSEFVLKSPVFKVKTSDKISVTDTNKTTHESIGDVQNFTQVHLLSTSTEISRSISTESPKENSFEIDEFTQSVTESVVQAPWTESMKHSITEFSRSKDISVLSQESLNETNFSFENYIGKAFELIQGDESVREISKKFENSKGRLLNRLKLLLSKQYSEKLLWQHRRRETNTEEVLTLEEHWNVAGNHFLKCRPRFSSKSEVKYIVSDAKWISALNPINNNAVSIRVHPPWEKLTLGKPETTVLLNVFFLEPSEKILTGTEEIEQPKFKAEVIADQHNKCVHLFYDALLACSVSPFLY